MATSRTKVRAGGAGREPRPAARRVDALVSALLAGDRGEARRLVDAAGPASRTDLVSDVLQPAQERIGELWYDGSIGVADEHRATAIVEELLFGAPPTPAAQPVPEGSRCLLASVGEEQHVLGLRALRLALEDDGWTCDFLGARTPLPELLRAAADGRPQVVMLSASYLPNTLDAARAVEGLHSTGARVMVGGAAFGRVPGLWQRIGADGYAPDARIAVRLARALVGR